MTYTRQTRAAGRSHAPTVIPRRGVITVTPIDRALMAIALATCAADLAAAMDRAMMFRSVPS